MAIKSKIDRKRERSVESGFMDRALDEPTHDETRHARLWMQLDVAAIHVSSPAGEET